MIDEFKTPAFCIETLGCKVNKTETLDIRENLLERGFREVSFEAGADIYIINTCTVTAKSDMQSRQLARQAFRQNSRAKIIITGCYAQINPEELKKLPGNIFVLKDKSRILEQLQGIFPNINLNQIQTENTTNYTRAFLKVQDGCDWRCAYCIVPQARGKSVSALKSDVINRAKKFINQGYKEIVLTGIHIGHYGLDFTPRSSLADLLKDLINLEGLGRIRLSSLEPVEFSDELIELIAKTDKICRHFHIPLQSADNGILNSMGRNYNFEKYRDLMLKLRELFPDAALGADVIVGFPGEDTAAYRNCYDNIAALPLTYFHVFSYSKRPGTRAALMSGQVDEEDKKLRSKELRELGESKKSAFFQAQSGKIKNCLILKQNKDDYSTALSDNYMNILIEKDADLTNKIVPVQITKIMGSKIFGEVKQKL